MKTVSILLFLLTAGINVPAASTWYALSDYTYDGSTFYSISRTGLCTVVEMEQTSADWSGNGNNFDTIGSPTYSTFCARGNYSLTGFSASNYLSCTKNVPVSTNSAIGFSCYITRTPTTSENMYEFTIAGLTYSIFLNTSREIIFYYDGAFPSGVTLPANTWNRILVNRTSNNIVLNVNASSSFTFTKAVTGTITSARIGSGSVGAFAGYIDGFRYYQRNLSASEITSDYANTLDRNITNSRSSIKLRPSGPIGGAGKFPIGWSAISDYSYDGATLYSISRTGLVAAYEFEQNGADWSGNGNNLIAVGTVPYVSGTSGTRGNWSAGPFSGTIRYRIPNGVISKLIGTTVFSFVGSFYLSSDKNARQFIVTWFDGLSTATNWGVEITSENVLRFERGAYADIDTALYNHRDWNRIGAVFNGSTFKAYLNGVSISTKVGETTTLANPTSSANVGNYVPSSSYFQGYLDDFRWYNRALTDAEIAADYANTLDRKISR